MELELESAIQLAKKAHKGQIRKYTREPYITHPFAVAGLVAAVTDDESMIIAAILHDVVEDSDIKIELINGIFGFRVGLLVDGLTDISKPEDGNRAIRKKIDRDHTALSDRDAKTIKLADLIDNTKSITLHDRKFAKIYMAEKRLLLEVLKEGDQTLYKIASELVSNYYLNFKK